MSFFNFTNFQDGEYPTLEIQLEPPAAVEEVAPTPGPVSGNETQAGASTDPQAPQEEKKVRANPVTFGMLSVTLFLCGDCRRCLSYQHVRKAPQYPDKNLISVPLCDSCLRLNGDVRKLYRDTMFQNTPAS